MAELRVPVGATKKKVVVGRGNAKKGGTSGKGHKGQNARSGGGVRPGFEGGQMPLFRRVARRGFSNAIFKKEYKAINLRTINDRFNEGDVVSLESLNDKGLIKSKHALVKILGDGELEKKLTFKVDKISKSAAEKIQKSGGAIESVNDEATKEE